MGFEFQGLMIEGREFRVQGSVGKSNPHDKPEQILNGPNPKTHT